MFPLSRSGRRLLQTSEDGEEMVENSGVAFFGLLESQMLCPLTFMLVRKLAWDAVMTRKGINVL